jgi:hypothetical protein
MRDYQLMLERERRQRRRRDFYVRSLILGTQRLAAMQQRITAQSDDNTHQFPNVAIMTGPSYKRNESFA